MANAGHQRERRRNGESWGLLRGSGSASTAHVWAGREMPSMEEEIFFSYMFHFS